MIISNRTIKLEQIISNACLKISSWPTPICTCTTLLINRHSTNYDCLLQNLWIWLTLSLSSAKIPESNKAFVIFNLKMHTFGIAVMLNLFLLPDVPSWTTYPWGIVHLKKKKVQMPRGVPGGMGNARIDWCISSRHGIGFIKKTAPDSGIFTPNGSTS